jgi:AraC-like DNA-binding protein
MQGRLTAMDSTTPARFSLDTDRWPERDRFQMFCEEFIRRYNRLDIETPDESSFHVSMVLQRLGQAGIAFSSQSPLSCLRTPELLRDGDDSVSVVLMEYGSAYYAQQSKEWALGPGDAIVCDSAYRGEYTYTSSAKSWCIKVPRAVIKDSLQRDAGPGGLKLDKNDSARRLLYLYLRETLDTDLSGPAARLHEQHILDLLALALGGTREAQLVAGDRGLRAARRAAVLREIANRSADTRLTAVTIALTLGITPRYVHHLLEETGKSFTHHLLDRRLERATTLLRKAKWRHHRIVDIAAEAGFTDLSYFNRMFRRRYGATPSDIRAAASREDAGRGD